MARIKRGTQARKRHNNLFARTKGFKHGRKNLIKLARQASLRAMHNAFKDRRTKKRVFRALWIVRLNAALREQGLTYSKFIPLLNKAKITINRKILSELAVSQPDIFKTIVDKAKAAQ